MFFFVGGVQPRTVTLDEAPRMCQACGLYQAFLKRVDHCLSLFFIPLFPIKRGVPFLECRSCGSIFSESGEALGGRAQSGNVTCPACGHSLQPGFRFCPFCGRQL